MARIIDDCIVETTTTTGTGPLTLAGAVTGFRTFASVCSVGDRVYYLIEAIDGSGNRTGEWETGFGTYSAAGELTRTTVHKSSNANAVVNLSAGTKRVILSLTAADVAYKGALVHKAADATAQNITSASVVTWDSEAYDTHAFHDNVTNNTRLTVPAGLAKRVRLSAQISFSALTADGWTMAAIYKNGSASWTGAGIAHVESGQIAPSMQVQTAVITPADGDYFEVFVQTETDTSLTIVAATSWFQIEVVE